MQSSTKTIITILITLYFSTTVAQNPWHLNLSNTLRDDPTNSEGIYNYLNINFDLSYSLYSYLEVGGYFGISSEHVWVKNGNGIYDVYGTNKIVPSYGALANLQILPLCNGENSWLDLYVSGRVGAYHKIPNNHAVKDRKMYAMYKLSPGIRFFPWRKMGLFYEYAVLKNNDIATPHTYGLTWRF